MSFINLGGLADGLKKGKKYDLQFARNMLWAYKAGNHEAVAACMHIAATNLAELGAAGPRLTDEVVQAALFHVAVDPTKGSRELMHEFERKYGNH